MRSLHLAAPSTGPPDAAGLERRELVVSGLVQGVGFRPFVCRLAASFDLAGLVTNCALGARIEVEGPPERVAAFSARLRGAGPPRAEISTITEHALGATGERGFVVHAHPEAAGALAAVAPDVRMCEACQREVDDPADRRYRHAFASCTDCGPRYTVALAAPYERVHTTMAGFALCPACAGEYEDPSSRRARAETIACPDCGPRLEVRVEEAVAALRQGALAVIKGLGGFHLACDATDEAAVRRVRALKQRPDKPLAVMVRDLAGALELCELGRAEQALLSSPEGPIVLARRRPDAPLAEAIAPGLTRLGVLLATSPLHHLLLAGVQRPLVMTSANRSEEPTAWRDATAERLASGTAVLVTHDRPIAARADDSVAMVALGRALVLRRSRGYVPRPLRLARPVAQPVLGLGGHQKNTVCLVAGDQAYLSAHVGDLGAPGADRELAHAIAQVIKMAGVEPTAVAHDLHPEYRSSEVAAGLGLATVAVQHHQAHLYSCLAEHGFSGPVVGIVADGNGLGDDGGLWGGEVLVADGDGVRRAGHLAPVAQPGGEAAVRFPWRMAVSYLCALGALDALEHPRLAKLARAGETDGVVSLIRGGVAPMTTSLGRLFDAVGAIVVGRGATSYEAQAAIELEALAEATTAPALCCPWREQGATVVVDTASLFGAVVEALIAARPVAEVAAGFHAGLAAGLGDAAAEVARRAGIGTVALSGGCFQNRLLLEATSRRLEEHHGLVVLVPGRVPPNDGGLSLGQAVLAAARIEREEP
ncbi:MAG: carbamoyltransferase HypF [Actinomycetota bacterium]|nr:carbamoyltransferase HypF [Actinomycetota bacterium]